MCPLRFSQNCVPTFGMSQSWYSFQVPRPNNDINKSRPATVLTGKQHLAAQEFPLSCVIGENDFNTCENNYNRGENYYSTGENHCDTGENSYDIGENYCVTGENYCDISVEHDCIKVEKNCITCENFNYGTTFCATGEDGDAMHLSQFGMIVKQ